jgi:signal transduction histidine kinase
LSAIRRHSQRLSWQLWASHYTVVVITLVAVVGSIVLLASAWLLRQGSVLREPALDAQVISLTVGNLVRSGAPESAISSVLAEVREGGVRTPTRPFDVHRGPPWGGPLATPWADLQNLEYILIVGPDGVIRASSDPARFPPGATIQSTSAGGAAAIAARALAAERDPARLSTQQGDALGHGAYPILGPTNDEPLAAVVVNKRLTLPRDVPNLIGRAIAAFGFVSFVVLLMSSGFALVVSAAAAYLLSRRLGGRLERLSQAADAVAQGDLAQRVEPGAPDELGRLGERFNLMAQRLQETIAALEVEKEKVETALRTQRDLVANVSHELRTPLASIRAHIESLAMAGETGRAGERESGPLRPGRADSAQRRGAGGADSVAGRTERRRDYLRVVEREVDQLSRLIGDLFALTTTTAEAPSLKIEPVRLNEVAAEVADSLGPLARQERHVKLVNSIDGALPPVLADRQRLTQVLANLLRNALRYTPEGGLISLSAAASDRQVAVEVADTGVGIPPEELPHVFDRFYRGGPARDRASGGAGLGLAIVREFVEAMGGKVTANSTIGEGSRFRFTLPSADS